MSNEIIRELDIDVSKQNTFGVLLAKQYDKATRYIVARITNMGVPVEIAAGSRVVINFTRPDGSSDGFAGSVENDGRVKVPLPYWALELDGNVTSDISIYLSDERLTTLQFIIKVEASNYSSSSASTDSHKDILLTLIDEVEASSAEVEALRQNVLATSPVVFSITKDGLLHVEENKI